jgi:rare lipoprotein A
MSGRYAIAASLAALLLPSCETLDLAGTGAKSDAAAAAAPEEGPVPGFARSGESFGGTMSWYSVRTNGGTRTASGERFADHEDTAAHRTLPFGTLVEVTNLANEESVVLRINDRGPFKHGRVLDVSIGAAKKLGFDKHGLAQCRVEVLKPVERTSPEEAEGEDAPEAAPAPMSEAVIAASSPAASGESGDASAAETKAPDLLRLFAYSPPKRSSAGKADEAPSETDPAPAPAEAEAEAEEESE